MTHVPYRGASPAFTDLIPGRVDCYFGSGTLLSYASSGQVRVLAMTGAKRDAAAPDVPTIAEAGVPGYDVTAWQALFVPAKTPPEIVRKISADTKAALTEPAIKDKLAASWLRGRRLFARGACQAAQIGNCQVERRHQVGRHQDRLGTRKDRCCVASWTRRKCRHVLGKCLRRWDAEKADQRQRALRLCRQRPRRRAAEKRDELAALQWIELHRCPLARHDP